jgi:hypothetical protein
MKCNMWPHDIEVTDAVVFIKFQNSIIMKYLFRLVVPQENDIAVTEAIPILKFQNFNFFEIHFSTWPRFEPRSFDISARNADH